MVAPISNRLSNTSSDHSIIHRHIACFNLYVTSLCIEAVDETIEQLFAQFNFHPLGNHSRYERVITRALLNDKSDKTSPKYHFKTEHFNNQETMGH
jgi:hypothetical protein